MEGRERKVRGEERVFKMERMSQRFSFCNVCPGGAATAKPCNLADTI